MNILPNAADERESFIPPNLRHELREVSLSGLPAKALRDLTKAGAFVTPIEVINTGAILLLVTMTPRPSAEFVRRHYLQHLRGGVS